MFSADLKRELHALSMAPTPLPMLQKNRQMYLTQTLQAILRDFPENPDIPPPSPTTPGAQAFFIPPRKVEVFRRLTERAAEAAGHGSRSRDLIERCRDVWGVASRRDKEKAMEGMIKRWGDSIGTLEERSWGKSVAEGVEDLVASGMGDHLPPVLQPLLSNLLGLIVTSIPTIFPTSDLPPPPPPASLMPIIAAAPDLLLNQPEARKSIENVLDELKALAVGEYVSIVGVMMGGVGMNGDTMRPTATGKDGMVEGFEKVASWMDREVANVRKVWGDGFP